MFNIDKGFMFAFRTKERKIFQHSVRPDFLMGLAVANGAINPVITRFILLRFMSPLNRFYSSQLAAVVIYRLDSDTALVGRGERKCAAVRGNVRKPTDKLAIEVDIPLPTGVLGFHIGDTKNLVLDKAILKSHAAGATYKAKCNSLLRRCRVIMKRLIV